MTAQKDKNSSVSKYWLDQATDEIVSLYPKGEILVSSGHSPSGEYHLGIAREFITSNCFGLGL